MRELDFIDWICSQRECDPAVVPVGPGDDCAVVVAGGERLLVSTDQLLDGVHFHLQTVGAEAFGRKAMARALSDIAAMAAVPLAAVACVSLPKGFSRHDAEAMYHGRRALGDRFDCPMVGGDLATWDGPAAISVTVFGRTDGIEPVLRSGAKVGDAICVTGQLGGAWLSDRHLTFVPRIAEARALASRFDLHAMIDISDGLALDLWRLCRASDIGADVEARQVPVHSRAEAGRKDVSPLEAALGDGEDYELLFTLPHDQAGHLLAAQPLEVPVARIGTIIEARAMSLVDAKGHRKPLQPTGWQHQT